jgi:hypothetical protein
VIDCCQHNDGLSEFVAFLPFPPSSPPSSPSFFSLAVLRRPPLHPMPCSLPPAVFLGLTKSQANFGPYPRIKSHRALSKTPQAISSRWQDGCKLSSRLVLDYLKIVASLSQERPRRKLVQLVSSSGVFQSGRDSDLGTKFLPSAACLHFSCCRPPATR